MADYLADAGFNVIEAWNADQALAILEGDPDMDAFLSDIQMPGKLDGIDLEKIIVDRWPEKGVVVVSGRGGPRPLSLAGTSRYVAKPYEPRQVVAAFVSMLETS